MGTPGDLVCPWGVEREIFSHVLPKSRCEELFTEYLLDKHHSELVKILEEVGTADSKHYGLNFSVVDLLHEHLALGTLLLHHPQKFIGQDLDFGLLGRCDRMLAKALSDQELVDDPGNGGLVDQELVFKLQHHFIGTNSTPSGWKRLKVNPQL